MAETKCLAMIEEEEIQVEDDFYENIEAPKFVDLTAPDSRRSGDDRNWFCFRVGCDQKHEEELDSEAIYKNFVLRVMAARSPNVRLRKALNRREASANLKCPLTAPAKSRVSRMGYISHKMTDNSVKVKPISKVAATPKTKVKQPPSVAKALTTPRNHQNKASKVEQFRSVQSKKSLTVVEPKSRLVAKTLVFHSPKKVLKIKSSVELKTPMRALCSAMKKLELNGVKKNGEGGNNSLSVAASRKQLRGREVKSRVFDSLYSNNRKEQQANNVTSLKEKKVKKVMQKRQVAVHHENDSSDMEIDEKSRCDSLERCHEKSEEPTRGENSVPVLEEASRGDITSLPNSSNEENNSKEGSESQERRDSVSDKGKVSEAIKRKDEENSSASDDKETSEARGGITSLSSSNNEESMPTERSENEERRNPVSDKGKTSEARKRKAEENSLASDDKENERLLTENDDKENASTPHENIVMTTNNDKPKKAILGSKHEDSRITQKKSTSTSTVSQVVKYRKLKPTNPKPFKLRTDERGILKEANLDRKIPSPLKETTVKGGGKTMRKHQNKRETCSTQSEQDTDYYSSCDEKSNRSGSIKSDNSNCKVRPKLSTTTPHRNPPGPKLQKPIDLRDNFKTKSQMTQRKIVRPRSALQRKKEKVVIATKLSVIMEKSSDIVKPKEAAKASKNDAVSSSPTSKSIGSTHRPHRPCSQGKRTLTVPKEPKFQSLHVPKDCTARKPA